MFVSKSLDYAFRGLTHLGLSDGRKVGMKEIADAREIPAHYLSKVLRTLVKAGIVRSDMGPGGGYCLAKAPRQISLRNVYEAVEGNFQVISCVDGDSDCIHFGDCSHVDVWAKVEGRILDLLDDLTLESFLDTEDEEHKNFVGIEQVHKNATNA